LDKESYSASIIAALSWQKKEIFTHAKEKDVEQLHFLVERQTKGLSKKLHKLLIYLSL
jgi:hypothetical protein